MCPARNPRTIGGIEIAQTRMLRVHPVIRFFWNQRHSAMASNRTSIARTSTHISGPNRRERRNGMDIDRAERSASNMPTACAVNAFMQLWRKKSSRNDYCERRKVTSTLVLYSYQNEMMGE